MTPTAVTAAGASYKIKITGGGNPLSGIQVIFYFQDSSGQFRNFETTTKNQGLAKVNVPAGTTVAFVEPVPYAGFWIMLREAPPSGSTLDCTPIVKATAGGAGWWHSAMGMDINNAQRGAGIKVGVIDTGRGPHANLAHVTLVGAFVDQQSLPPAQATDVAEHGTHTTGLEGARPKKGGDYVGMAPGVRSVPRPEYSRARNGETAPPMPTSSMRSMPYRATKQCDLIKMRLGGGPPSQAEQDAIRDAAQRGTLCICSAGNEAGPIDFPAAYPECAAVSAVGLIGWGRLRLSPSRTGHKTPPSSASNTCSWPRSVASAPRSRALPRRRNRLNGPGPLGATGLYMEMDGTSMASPAAYGALAVILSQDASYKSLPRDISRNKAARVLLAQHCQSIGLAIKFEGRGLIKA